MNTIPVAVIRLGLIVITPHCLDVVPTDDILAAIQRHQAGDWGEVPEEDRVANNQSLIDGTRILSAYRSAKGVKFWIITEADRSSTTILLPEDY